MVGTIFPRDNSNCGTLLPAVPQGEARGLKWLSQATEGAATHLLQLVYPQSLHSVPHSLVFTRSWAWLCSVLALGTQFLSFHLLCQPLLTALHRFQMALPAVTPSFQSVGNGSPFYLQEDCVKKQLKAGPRPVPHTCLGVSDTLH